MANNEPTWDEIVAAVRAYGNSAAAQDAIARNRPMPLGEVGTEQVGDDEFVIHVGTHDGTVIIREDSVTYGDGVQVPFEDDDHRIQIVYAEVHDYVTRHLD